jgi:hypothetical protein
MIRIWLLTMICWACQPTFLRATGLPDDEWHSEPEPLIGRLVVLALVAGALWLFLRPRYLFVIDVQDGQARLRKGKATFLFVREVEEIFRDQAVESGSVRGLAAGKGVVLRFSRQVPESCRQRIRNLSQVHG